MAFKFLAEDGSEGSSPIASREGSLSGFSLQIDINWSRKCRSYLFKRIRTSP
jgi:hypothetical protein